MEKTVRDLRRSSLRTSSLVAISTLARRTQAQDPPKSLRSAPVDSWESRVILEDHVLWLELRRELRDRRVVTSLAVREVAHEFLHARKSGGMSEADFSGYFSKMGFAWNRRTRASVIGDSSIGQSLNKMFVNSNGRKQALHLDSNTNLKDPENFLPYTTTQKSVAGLSWMKALSDNLKTETNANGGESSPRPVSASTEVSPRASFSSSFSSVRSSFSRKSDASLSSFSSTHCAAPFSMENEATGADSLFHMLRTVAASLENNVTTPALPKKKQDPFTRRSSQKGIELEVLAEEHNDTASRTTSNEDEMQRTAEMSLQPPSYSSVVKAFEESLNSINFDYDEQDKDGSDGELFVDFGNDSFSRQLAAQTA